MSRLRWLDANPEERIQMNDYTTEVENVLPRTDDFDCVVEDLQMLDILRHVIGENVTFEQFSFMIRDPSAEAVAYRGWHRDLTREFGRRKEIDAISSVYNLTDVTENDTCFAIIPESHNRLIDINPAEVGPAILRAKRATEDGRPALLEMRTNDEQAKSHMRAFG